jgi:hypothetical protein
MDIEDQQEEARRRAEFNKWQLQQSAEMSHDTSEVEAERAKWEAHAAEWGPKVAAKRARQEETRKMIRADRRLREMGYKGV